MQVGDHDIEASYCGMSKPCVDTTLNCHRIAFTFQLSLTKSCKDFIVLNDQDFGPLDHHDGCSTGSTIRNVVPSPILVSKSNRPACLATIRAATDSPRP